MPTQNLAIMFTDIKGFTARVSSGKRRDLKQLHLLSVYRWVFNPDKAVNSFGYSRSELARRNLAALEALWKKQ